MQNIKVKVIISAMIFEFRLFSSTMSEDWRQGTVLEQYKHMLESGFLSDCSFLVGQEPDTKVGLYF
jgi:hypothetical protein